MFGCGADMKSFNSFIMLSLAMPQSVVALTNDSLQARFSIDRERPDLYRSWRANCFLGIERLLFLSFMF
jgi:hypothetical protein